MFFQFSYHKCQFHVILLLYYLGIGIIVSGEGRIIRYIGPNFGVCMYLCVESHGEIDTKEQPTLKKIKAVRVPIKLHHLKQI